MQNSSTNFLFWNVSVLITSISGVSSILAAIEAQISSFLKENLKIFFVKAVGDNRHNFFLY